MLAFFVFVIVLMLLDLCWQADEISRKCKKEYFIIVLRESSESLNDSDESDINIAHFGKNRINHY